MSGPETPTESQTNMLSENKKYTTEADTGDYYSDPETYTHTTTQKFNTIGQYFLTESETETGDCYSDPGTYTHTTTAQEFNTIGQHFLTKKKYPAALDAFERAVEADPECTKYRYNMGVACLNLARYPEALDNFYVVRDIDPKDEKILKAIKATANRLNDAGRRLAEEGNYEAALDAFERAVEADPEDPNYIYKLGEVYFNLERYSDALDSFQAANQILPENEAILIAIEETNQRLDGEERIGDCDETLRWRFRLRF
mgnify:CR=1 FL=1